MSVRHSHGNDIHSQQLFGVHAFTHNVIVVLWVHTTACYEYHFNGSMSQTCLASDRDVSQYLQRFNGRHPPLYLKSCTNKVMYLLPRIAQVSVAQVKVHYQCFIDRMRSLYSSAATPDEDL